MPKSSDVIVVKDDPKPKVTTAAKVDVKDAKKVQDYLKAKGMAQAKVSKQKWTSPDDIIESVVRLHNGTLEAYRQGGLG
jgi:hypothetical protein